MTKEKVKVADPVSGFEIMSLEPDADLSVNGKWCDFFGSARLKIAQNQNSAHQAFINQQYRIHRRKLDLNTKESDALSEEIGLEGTARHLLKDWEAIVINGVDTPYTYKIGMDIMKRVPTLKAEVEEQSRALQNFQIQDDDEDLENVKTVSPGS